MDALIFATRARPLSLSLSSLSISAKKGLCSAGPVCVHWPPMTVSPSPHPLGSREARCGLFEVFSSGIVTSSLKCSVSSDVALPSRLHLVPWPLVRVLLRPRVESRVCRMRCRHHHVFLVHRVAAGACNSCCSSVSSGRAASGIAFACAESGSARCMGVTKSFGAVLWRARASCCCCTRSTTMMGRSTRPISLARLRVCLLGESIQEQAGFLASMLERLSPAWVAAALLSWSWGRLRR